MWPTFHHWVVLVAQQVVRQPQLVVERPVRQSTQGLHQPQAQQEIQPRPEVVAQVEQEAPQVLVLQVAQVLYPEVVVAVVEPAY